MDATLRHTSAPEETTITTAERNHRISSTSPGAPELPPFQGSVPSLSIKTPSVVGVSRWETYKERFPRKNQLAFTSTSLHMLREGLGLAHPPQAILNTGVTWHHYYILMTQTHWPIQQIHSDSVFMWKGGKKTGTHFTSSTRKSQIYIPFSKDVS